MNLSHGGNENTQAGVTELPQSGAERIALRTLRGCERSAERCLSCRAPEGVSAPGEGARQAAPLCDGLRGSQSLGWGWLGAVPGRGGGCGPGAVGDGPWGPGRGRRPEPRSDPAGWGAETSCGGARRDLGKLPGERLPAGRPWEEARRAQGD